ncbi:NADP-dependent oxidoreductase domain-containing protein [Pyronema omphalodes]|nr:NADP-dependent oxidoreductase domain-containing protein [Pyronema omphalodes]
MVVPEFTLNTGAKIPALGLGTWNSPAGAVEKAVYHAITVSGLRHIDCAFAYGNEREVGAALSQVFSEGKVKREDVFITTKLWGTWHNRAEANIEESLKALGLDYVDLYLMHWPVPMNANGNHPIMPTRPDGMRDLDEGWTWQQTWKAMEKLVEAGKAKAIGVSNFSEAYLKELLKEAKIIPAVNQIENHPLLPQDNLVKFCQQNGILVTAYSPFGSAGGPLLSDETVIKVAQKHGISTGNVLINYQLQRGIATIPKSITPTRIDENAKVVKLTDEDMDELNGIHKVKGPKRFVAPPWPVDFLFEEANWGEGFKPLVGMA